MSDDHVAIKNSYDAARFFIWIILLPYDIFCFFRGEGNWLYLSFLIIVLIILSLIKAFSPFLWASIYVVLVANLLLPEMNYINNSLFYGRGYNFSINNPTHTIVLIAIAIMLSITFKNDKEKGRN